MFFLAFIGLVILFVVLEESGVSIPQYDGSIPEGASANIAGIAFSFFAFILFAVVNFGYLLPLSVRRFHDFGMSGWFCLAYIPLSLILMVILLLVPGDRNDNKYGKPIDKDVGLFAALFAWRYE